MSRIGKVPVPIPEKVTVQADNLHVSVDGPKGKLEKTFKGPIKITVADGNVNVQPTDKSRMARAMYGTSRSIIAGMVKGVTEGFSKDLELVGVGFRAVLSGNVLDMNLGYSHPINFRVPDGISITVNENTKIKVEGTDKQLVGEVAARIKRYYPVEPYKGKGVRIIGQFVRRKEGKKTG